MLIEKTMVVQKLNELLAYSKGRDDKNANAIEALFSPVFTVLNSYFDNQNPSLGTALNDVVQYMYFDIDRRTTKYQNEFEQGLSNDFPIGYNDVTLCFYQFETLLGVSNSTFFSAFVYGIPADGSGTDDVPQSNSYLTNWETEIQNAISGDLSNVKTLAEWCKYSGGNADLVSLLEDRGEIVESKSQKEVSDLIYIERKVLSIVQSKNLGTYVPSIYKKG